MKPVEVEVEMRYIEWVPGMMASCAPGEKPPLVDLPDEEIVVVDRDSFATELFAEQGVFRGVVPAGKKDNASVYRLAAGVPPEWAEQAYQRGFTVAQLDAEMVRLHGR